MKNCLAPLATDNVATAAMAGLNCGDSDGGEGNSAAQQSAIDKEFECPQPVKDDGVLLTLKGCSQCLTYFLLPSEIQMGEIYYIDWSCGKISKYDPHDTVSYVDEYIKAWLSLVYQWLACLSSAATAYDNNSCMKNCLAPLSPDDVAAAAIGGLNCRDVTVVKETLQRSNMPLTGNLNAHSL